MLAFFNQRNLEKLKIRKNHPLLWKLFLRKSKIFLFSSPLSSPVITLNDEAPKKKVKGKKSVAEKQRMEIGVDDECNEQAKSHVKSSLEEVPKNSKKVRLSQRLVYFRLIGCHK